LTFFLTKENTDVVIIGIIDV